MADPKDLLEVADALHHIRDLAAVLRHKELAEPLRCAEEWARQKYQRVNEGRDEASRVENRDESMPPKGGMIDAYEGYSDAFGVESFR